MARELATEMATRAKVQQVVTRKGLILEIVGIDGVCSRMALDTWITSNKVEITSVRDPDLKPMQTQSALTTREWSYIVDLRTMKIVSKYFGSYGGNVDGNKSTIALNRALDDINGRL